MRAEPPATHRMKILDQIRHNPGYSVRLIQLTEGDGGGWLAHVPELKEALDLWLEVAKEKGKSIAEPAFHAEANS